MTRRLLTFNCHEAYVHALGWLDAELHVVDGLPGRYVRRWDERIRPIPENVRLVTLEQACCDPRGYDAIIAHNVSDLMSVRPLSAPKVLVIHVSLTARLSEERAEFSAEEMRDQLVAYLDLIGGSVVAVSATKRDSYGLDCPVIRPAAPADWYHGYRGDVAAGLRVANQVAQRRDRLAWSTHERVVSGVEWELVGHNPDPAFASRPAASWTELREFYRSRRFLVHTAKRGHEDGYNLAVIEAMCTGMPVVSTQLDLSPVVDGTNGFISDDPEYLHRAARRLIDDPDLARRLGESARRTIQTGFSVSSFVGNWESAIDSAIDRWARMQAVSA